MVRQVPRLLRRSGAVEESALWRCLAVKREMCLLLLLSSAFFNILRFVGEVATFQPKMVYLEAQAAISASRNSLMPQLAQDAAVDCGSRFGHSNVLHFNLLLLCVAWLRAKKPPENGLSKHRRRPRKIPRTGECCAASEDT